MTLVDIESRLAAEAASCPEAEDILRRLAGLYLWDRDAAIRSHPLAAPELPVLIWRLLNAGMAEDVAAARSIWGRRVLLDTLRAAPPGRLEPRSWIYWHLQLGESVVPPCPSRQSLLVTG